MTDNPRRRLRSLVKRNKPPESPLFVPLAFALAAQIDAQPLAGFLRDATQLTKGVGALHQALATDGVVTFSDAHAMAESLGAVVDAQPYPPVVLAPASPAVADETMISTVLAHSRIAAGLETTRRLRQTLSGDPVLTVNLPGPVQLAGDAYGHLSMNVLETSGQVLVAVCKAFGEAGAQLFVLNEAPVPGESEWLAVLGPIVNVIRFYQGLPIVAGTPGLTVPDGALPCVAGESGSEPLCARLLEGVPADWAYTGSPCSVLLSDAEIAPDTDIGELRRVCAGLRGARKD